MPKSQKVKLLTPNQVVALNIAHNRRRLGWTQPELCRRLEPFLGQRWSVAVLSAAERSVDGKRVREFTADEMVALARLFEIPVAKLLLLVEDDDPARMAVPDRKSGLTPKESTLLVVGMEVQELDRRFQDFLPTITERLNALAIEALKERGMLS